MVTEKPVSSLENFIRDMMVIAQLREKRRASAIGNTGKVPQVYAEQQADWMCPRKKNPRQSRNR